MPVSPIARGLWAPLVLLSLLSPRVVLAQDADAPTTIEVALSERTCSSTHAPVLDTDAYQQCLKARITWMRADFGRDLARLSAADRKKIDASCSRLNTGERREAYLDCLSDQLIAVHNRIAKANPPAAAPTAAADALDPLAGLVGAATAPAESPVPSRSRLKAVLIAGTPLAVSLAGLAFVKLRGRRVRRVCRVCGNQVPDSDLCATCRHEAAETLRRAASERALSERLQVEEERRAREEEDARREQQARDEEQRQRLQADLARKREEEERARQEEEAERQRQAAARAAATVVGADTFDPYLVLGVSRDVSPAELRVAYEEAKSKYDPDLVSSLGDEARTHFQAKADAVDRAYEMIAGVPSPTPVSR